ncbi:unnamed protein product [Calypogeia fissa]
MKKLWDGQIRPAILTSSLIIFLFLVVGQHSSVNRYQEPGADLVAKSNSPRKFVQVDAHGRNKRDYGGGKFGATRELLAVGEDELTGKGADDISETPQKSNFGAEMGQQPNLSSQNDTLQNPVEPLDESVVCGNVRLHPGFADSCSYVKSIPQCSSGTLIEYTHIFYCWFSATPIIAYIALTFWLFSLFYMLGNTAADFFCCALQKLSKLLHLAPTVAGVTLLPLGNGAPDVFASIAAFVGASGQGQVGLNSVLGGATFISSVVAGSVSLAIVGASASPVHLDRGGFLRDIGFFFFTLASLTTILYVGKIHFWGAVGYTCIYAFYAFTVAAVEILRSHRDKFPPMRALQPLLSGISDPNRNEESEYDAQGDYEEIVDNHTGFSTRVEASLPQWMWCPHVAIYSHQNHLDRRDSFSNRPLWGWSEEESAVNWYSLRGICSRFVGWPLTIPRRLTIPLVEDVGWSKFYAVCSATFAPILLAMVWAGNDGGPPASSWKEYVVAGTVGIVLGGVSHFTLKEDHPPRRFLFPWAAGGFIMSIVWFYIIANELVAALVALGVVLEIDPAILGLTVLAWGNSIGDLMSNLALVYYGGDGMQIAFSGCYAGPLFNTLMGIGLSFVLASWKSYPDAFVIPQDDNIYVTLAFLVAGLLWALCMLPPRRMQPTKTLGVGLLILYAAFLSFRLAHSLGFNVSLAGGRR